MTDDLERRLRDSLHAYADLVQAPDDGAVPTRTGGAPNRRTAPPRWRGALLAAAAAAFVVSGSVWIVTGQHDGADSTAASGAAQVDAPESQAPQAAEAAPPGSAADSAQGLSAPPVGVPVPYDLYTHCGVLGADIGGVWFAADPPLVEGAGNPPPGWGNPDQPGTMMLLAADQAVFTDDAGHSVRLRADDAARPPLCE